ncbi:hypothetical protein RLO149_c016720 [Roseobacter litoralis Och 149]|uniref:Uncharacterized protein n=1 Tax=Roseobacter litoralis (strain ATCC 49566 / DSM 6996 / JCM 21268 / NBRC 15278 / OCh 149) TaxID=391595 RepID=F7ZHQ4_ROSLO|nr:hypothetical protein RLO149_c016720 [Roseobacter litoralis Och 149]
MIFDLENYLSSIWRITVERGDIVPLPDDCAQMKAHVAIDWNPDGDSTIPRAPAASLRDICFRLNSPRLDGVQSTTRHAPWAFATTQAD